MNNLPLGTWKLPKHHFIFFPKIHKYIYCTSRGVPRPPASLSHIDTSGKFTAGFNITVGNIFPEIHIDRGDNGG